METLFLFRVSAREYSVSLLFFFVFVLFVVQRHTGSFCFIIFFPFQLISAAIVLLFSWLRCGRLSHGGLFDFCFHFGGAEMAAELGEQTDQTTSTERVGRALRPTDRPSNSLIYTRLF